MLLTHHDDLMLENAVQIMSPFLCIVIAAALSVGGPRLARTFTSSGRRLHKEIITAFVQTFANT